MWLKQRDPWKGSREFKTGEQYNLVCVFNNTERHDNYMKCVFLNWGKSVALRDSIRTSGRI